MPTRARMYVATICRAYFAPASRGRRSSSPTFRKPGRLRTANTVRTARRPATKRSASVTATGFSTVRVTDAPSAPGTVSATFWTVVHRATRFNPPACRADSAMTKAAKNQ